MNRLASSTILALGAFLLCACTTVDYDFSDVKKSRSSVARITPPSGPVKAPRFGDRDPHEWTAKRRGIIPSMARTSQNTRAMWTGARYAPAAFRLPS